jgi:large subunit ribosomal protein L27
MAHTKAAGAAKRTVNVAGKRLGFKKFGGEHVIPGNIILRQRGTKFHAGHNVMVGRDHTLFATAEGHIGFRHMTGHKHTKQLVDVLPLAPIKTLPSKAKVIKTVLPVKAEIKIGKAKVAKVKATAKGK